MFYQEKWIDGELYFKNTPNGNWRRFTEKMLLKRLIDRESEILSLTYDIEVLKNKLEKLKEYKDEQ